MADLANANTSNCNLLLEELNLSESEIAELFLPFEQNVGLDRGETIEDVDQFIENQKNINTVKSTVGHLKNVQRWLFDHKKETRLIEFIPPEHLNDFLAELFISIRKTNGDDYEPSTLESLKNSIERHLKEKQYPYSLKDKPFDKCIRALNAKKVQLKKAGLGRLPNKCCHLEPEDEDRLFQAGVFGTQTPKSLQTTLFYYFGKMFGLRARDEARQLTFGDIELKETMDGQKYLQFQERSTKTRDGSNTKNCRETMPKIFSNTENKDRDPVAMYDLYKSRRPAGSMEADSPFFLTPIPEKRLRGTDEEAWYYSRPMGVSTLGGLVKAAAEEVGLGKRITNHSMRKTTVTSLSRAGVPPQKIMKITGHKNIQSITHYDAELTDTEHRKICGILQGNGYAIQNENESDIPTKKGRASENIVKETASLSPKLSKSNEMPPFMSGSNFYNCTFQFTGKF